MRRLIVVERPERWPFEIPGVEVIAAREYLTADLFAGLRHATVVNCCRSYSQNTIGYYVSLLATARGHRPMPSVTTAQGLAISSVVRVASDELHDLIQSHLRPLRSSRFELSVYFGRNVAARYDRLARALFNQFPVPLLRARFERGADGGWILGSIRALSASEVPDAHRETVLQGADRYLRNPSRTGKKKREYRYDLAILWRKDDPQAPSDERAIRRFVRAAEGCGIRAEVIGPEDFARLEIYDALFIRETTQIGHHTHRFALRGQAAGLVVIDDPESIVRCTNKVYQAELFRRHGIATPKTLVVHTGNRDMVAEVVGLPCVLKDPAGSFSSGVLKATTESELQATIDRFLEGSDLVIAQAWSPTDFDWRIGVLDGALLFAARYHMARGHWQIVRPGGTDRGRYGRVEAVPLHEAPEAVTSTALRVANLIGDGLYGVDLKALDDGSVVVTEVNDNPNIDAGGEDAVLGEALYERVAQVFRDRLDRRGERA